MADSTRSFDVIEEPCTNCRHETPHRVVIELRSESAATEDTRYGRQPYRISTCLRCGEELAGRVHGR